jgi:hypothetical protein
MTSGRRPGASPTRATSWWSKPAARGVGKQSGAQVEIEFTILVNLTEGRVTRLCNFMDRGKALEAAGLRE